MANTFFKSLTESDRTSSRTLLHEAIPITGTLVSGTYDTNIHSDGENRGKNIKTFSHGMFQSVYDYPHASSSANHIFDITLGVAPYIPSGSNSVGFQGKYQSADQLRNLVVTGSGLGLANKKRAIYNQMAQVLVGYDTSGSIKLFDSDGNFSTIQDKILDPTFLNFSRLLTKDEIKKGSFSMDIGVHRIYTTPFGTGSGHILNIADTGADSNYKVNSPAGEYGILKASNKAGSHPVLDSVRVAISGSSVGLIYYQAGIVVLDSSKIFRIAGQPDNHPSTSEYSDHDGLLHSSAIGSGSANFKLNATNVMPDKVLISGSIDVWADNIRHRIQNISFNNTTELNSTIYFCRANHNEFNYSSNITYLSGSQIRVKGGEVLNPPKSYVTTVGLYSSDNELLAVAKLSEPLRKDPTNELTLRVRLDY